MVVNYEAEADWESIQTKWLTEKDSFVISGG